MKDGARIPAPPDGGYGWVVAFASFLIVFMLYGTTLSYGLLLDHVMEFYQVTPGAAAIPNSLTVCVTLVFGPLSGVCVTKFGSRLTTMLGALLAAFGFAVSAFMTKFSYFCFFYGIIAGIGESLMYLPANVHVGLYFEKRRALATGIFTMGGGVGLMVVGPLTTFLLHQYGWQGTILLIGGMFLHGAVCGALFRPLEYKHLDQSNLENADKFVECILEEPCDLKSTTLIPTARIAFLRSISTDPSSKTGSNEFQPLVRNNRNISVSQEEVTQNSGSTGDVLAIKELSINPMQRLDAYYSGSIQQLAEYHKVGENLDLYRASTIRIPDKEEERLESVPSNRPTRLHRITSTLHTSFDLHLLKSPKMLILVAANMFGYLGVYVPFNFTASLLVNNGGTTSQISVMYIGSGIANIIGPPIFGWLANNTRASALVISATNLLISGAMTLGVSFFDNYYLILIYFALYGIFVCAFFGLGAIVVVECFGLEQLTSGFGLILLARGLAASVGSPIGGAIYYATDSFIITFAYSSAMLILSCFTFLLIPCINKLEFNRRNLI